MSTANLEILKSRRFLPLFITGPAPARQWRYTDAPDADARLVQAMYWAKVWSDARGGSATVNALTAKAAQMGDYLRYAFFDKYFKTMGCGSPNCPAGTGYNAAHFLLSWYFAWGGAVDSSAGWGLLDIPAALAAPVPSSDTGEPNDDLDQVKPRRLLGRLGLAHRLQPQPLRLPEPDGGLGARQHARAAAAFAQRRARLDHQPGPAGGVLPLAAVGRRRHRRRYAAV